MYSLKELLSSVGGFTYNPSVAMDMSHALCILGSVLSKKPENILEVGIGTGLISQMLCNGIKYNNRGNLTCVDNWFDWAGKKPDIQSFHDNGINVIEMDEHKYVSNCVDNKYDFLVSDGDHHRSGLWFEEYLRIIKHDGFMFFHDVNEINSYPNMKLITEYVRNSNLPYHIYLESSREDEACERGLLFVINKKE